jgi:hypothetical protein
VTDVAHNESAIGTSTLCRLYTSAIPLPSDCQMFTGCPPSLAEPVATGADTQASDSIRLPLPGNQVVRRPPSVHSTMIVHPLGGRPSDKGERGTHSELVRAFASPMKSLVESVILVRIPGTSPQTIERSR